MENKGESCLLNSVSSLLAAGESMALLGWTDFYLPFCVNIRLLLLEILRVSNLEVMAIDKVIDLAKYKKNIEQCCVDSELCEIEEVINILCEEVQHVAIPMFMLKIKEIAIDWRGNILNMKYQDDDDDEINLH